MVDRDLTRKEMRRRPMTRAPPGRGSWRRSHLISDQDLTRKEMRRHPMARAPLGRLRMARDHRHRLVRTIRRQRVIRGMFLSTLTDTL